MINTVPADRRDQTRAFLYGGPTQVGTILAGVIALVGERSLSPTVLAGIGFACAAIAVVAMIGVRRAYPRELVAALREGRPHVFDAAPAGSEPFGRDARERTGRFWHRATAHSPIPTRASAGSPPTCSGSGPGGGARAAAGLPARRRCRRPGDRDRARSRRTTPEALPTIVGTRSTTPTRRCAWRSPPRRPRSAPGPRSRPRRSVGSLEDPDPVVRSRGCGRPRGEDDPGARSVLIELAGSRREQDRLAGVRRDAGARGTRRSSASLRPGSPIPSAAVRAEAAGALATLDPARALGSAHRGARRRAAGGPGRRGCGIGTPGQPGARSGDRFARLARSPRRGAHGAGAPADRRPGRRDPRVRRRDGGRLCRELPAGHRRPGRCRRQPRSPAGLAALRDRNVKRSSGCAQRPCSEAGPSCRSRSRTCR